MVISDIYEMLWQKGPVEVKNLIEIKGSIIFGVIEPVYNSPLRCSYNPFDYYENISTINSKSLYIQFISVNENDIDDIKEFTTNFGLLGTYFNPEMSEHMKLTNYTLQLEALLEKLDKSIKYSNLHGIKETAVSICQEFEKKHRKKMFHKREKYPKYLAWDHINEIIKEIIHLRSLVELWKCIQNEDVPGCIKNVKLLRQYYFSQVYVPFRVSYNPENEDNFILVESFDENTSFDVIFEKAFLRVFMGELNYKLQVINPLLSYNSRLSNNTEISGSWKTPTLLHTMYLMFYLDITKRRDIKKCRNETCADYFVVHGKYNKIYCDETCARQQVQREYKRRKRLKKKQQN